MNTCGWILRLTIIFLAVTVGCASTPPSRVENNRYYNPRYEFSLQIPTGWEYSEVVPDWYLQSLAPEERGKVKLVLLNSDQKAFISVSADLFKVSLFEISMAEERFDNSLEKLYQDRKETLAKEGIVDYRHKIYKRKDCATGCIVAGEEWSSADNQFNIVKKEVMYRCYNDKTCSVIFLLLSKKETFSENNLRFSEVVASFLPM